MESFTPALTRNIINQRVDSEMQRHIALLRQNAPAGALTLEQDDEFKDLIESVDVIPVRRDDVRPIPVRIVEALNKVRPPLAFKLLRGTLLSVPCQSPQ